VPTGRQFPGKTLEQALRVPQALKDKNGGNAWPPDQVAKALGVGASGTTFYYVAASARDYGLTTGSRETAEIVLTELGRRAVYPPSGEAQKQAYLEAFLRVDLFKRVLEHYGGSSLPEERSWPIRWSKRSGSSRSRKAISLRSSPRTAASWALEPSFRLKAQLRDKLLPPRQPVLREASRLPSQRRIRETPRSCS
jgi:hypothetical protein